MKNNYSTMDVDSEEIECKDINITSYIFRICTTLYHTYQQLHCTRHIQMTSNYSTIEVKGEETVYKNDT